MRFLEIRLQLDGTLECSDSAVQVTAGFQFLSNIELSLRIVRVDSHGLAELCQSTDVITLATQGYAQQNVRIRQPGIYPDSVAKISGSSRKIAKLSFR